MTKAGDVFSLSLALMNIREGSGDETGYRERALGLMNLLQAELYDVSEGTEAGCGHAVPPLLRSFDSTVQLDDLLARTVMPYGLAAMLFNDEEPTLAEGFLSKFRELKSAARGSIPPELSEVTDFYGISEYSEMGAW